MKKLFLALSLCILALLLCSCSVLGGLLNSSKLEFEETDGGYAVSGRGENTDTAVEIPAEYKGKPVVAIGNNAFARNVVWELMQGTDAPQIQSLTIPDSVTSIGSGAFSGCNELSAITLPAGVTKIGASAFAKCTALTSIEIPEGVTTIAANTFSGCTALTSVKIPASVTTIEAGAFMNCAALSSIELPSALTVIGESAFEGCEALSAIKLPDGVTEIGVRAFKGCKVMQMTALPSALTSIGAEAFADCDGLVELTISDQVENMGGYVFTGTPETLTVSVCYDSEAPKGWDEEWWGGMDGKALNTSEVYYTNVVVPNLAETEELRQRIDSRKAQVEAYADQIDGKLVTLNNLKKNASINPTDAQLKRISDMQREIQSIRNQQSEVNREIRELEEELAGYKTTNQLN